MSTIAPQRPQRPTVDGVDFAVPTHYTIGDRFPTWAEAAKSARARIRTTRYLGQRANPNAEGYHPRRYRQTDDALEVDTRQFVQMREVQPIQDRPSGPRTGSDGVVRTWEVFADGTAELC